MSNKPSEDAKKQFEGKLWLGNLYGVYYFDGKLFHPRMIFVLIMGALEAVMHFHGLSQTYHDIAYVCNSMSIYCLVIQLLTRLFSRFARSEEEKIMGALKKLLTFYEREEQNHDHRAILTANLKISQFILDSYLTVNCMIFCVPNSTAWIVSWYTGEFILFSPIYLPIVDPHTLNGYIISSALLLFYTMLVYVTFMTADVIFMFLIYQCIPMVDIYSMKLKNFGEKLMNVKMEKKKANPRSRLLEKSTSKAIVKVKTQKEHEGEKKEEIENIEDELIVLIEEFNDYNLYVRTVIEYMEYTTFAATTFNSLAIGMSFIVALKYSKAIGGVVIIYLCSQVLIPCVVGTMISRQKERLQNDLFAFPWYELSLAKQKIFLQFFHLVQNSTEFKVPYIGALNMERFTDIMNGAYSCMMYLLKSLK